tara:strand:+ start:683 stop:946 length:264 start_codon:yes stop_codon:yes gene_type:complete
MTVESMLSIFLSPFSGGLSFVIITWFWWKLSRRFFTFLFYFSEKTLKFKKHSWQNVVFNYLIFGPLGLANISAYLYILLIFLKFFIL